MLPLWLGMGDVQRWVAAKNCEVSVFRPGRSAIRPAWSADEPDFPVDRAASASIKSRAGSASGGSSRRGCGLLIGASAPRIAFHVQINSKNHRSVP